MPKAKNAKADEALNLYRQGLKLTEIATILDLPEGTIRSWKKRMQWGKSVATKSATKKCNVAKRKRGGQPGNINGAGAPLGNKRAEKHGFLTKYLPDETREIFFAVEKADPLDLLWDQIQLQYAAIVRAQKIAYVQDIDDRTITVEGNSVRIQQAWDKQAAFLNAQSRAMSALANLIRHYETLLQERGERVTEEQRARIDKLRAETARLKQEEVQSRDDGVEVINDAPPG